MSTVMIIARIHTDFVAVALLPIPSRFSTSMAKNFRDWNHTPTSCSRTAAPQFQPQPSTLTVQFSAVPHVATTISTSSRARKLSLSRRARMPVPTDHRRLPWVSKPCGSSSIDLRPGNQGGADTFERHRVDNVSFTLPAYLMRGHLGPFASNLE